MIRPFPLPIDLTLWSWHPDGLSLGWRRSASRPPLHRAALWSSPEEGWRPL